MEPASIANIKKELQNLSVGELTALCLRLAKYKKENKELLHYFLFESDNEDQYIEEVKRKIAEQFGEINHSHIYYLKKSTRKILRYANKHINYSGKAKTAVEILIFFCSTLKGLPVQITTSASLTNLYESQVKKIQKTLHLLHEDIQYDYRNDLAALSL